MLYFTLNIKMKCSAVIVWYYLLSWYVVQNWDLGFFFRRKATVTRTSSKSENGVKLSVRFLYVFLAVEP